MQKMSTSRRVGVTLGEAQYADIERLSKDAGMSLSQYCTLCISLGLKTMKRITEPENLYTPEQQAALMAAMGIDKEKMEQLVVQQIGMMAAKDS